MFEDALNYPRRGDDALVTLLVGGFLPLVGAGVALVAVVLSFVGIGVLLFPVAFVPQIVLAGYFVAVARDRLEGESEPPAFDDWRQLFVDGLKVTVAQVGYALPLLALWFLGFVLFLGGALTVNGGQNGAGALGALLVALLGFGSVVYGLAVAYVFPAAAVNLAREGTLGAAFDRDVLGTVCLDGDYAVAWLLAAVVYVVGAGVLGPMLVWVLFVGLVVVFYAQVSAVYLVTEGYADALELDRECDRQSTLDESLSGRGDERPAVETSNEVAVKGAEVYPAIARDDTEEEPAGETTDEDTFGEASDGADGTRDR